MKMPSRSRPGVLSALVLLAVGACAPPDRDGAGGEMGTVSADLMLSPTASLDTASYSISGPNMNRAQIDEDSAESLQMMMEILSMIDP